MHASLCARERDTVSIKISHPNVDHSVSSVTLQRVQLQVTLKVPGVQSRDGQAVPVTSLDKNKVQNKNSLKTRQE